MSSIVTTSRPALSNAAVCGWPCSRGSVVSSAIHSGVPSGANFVIRSAPSSVT